MSLEAKEAQREKSKFAMKRKWEAEIEDKKNLQRQKNKLAMKKKTGVRDGGGITFAQGN